MKTWLKNSRKLMAAFGAVAVMLVAGWQFGVSGTEVPFSEKEVALEKAIEGSGGAGTTCYASYNSCLFWNCSYFYRCKPYGPCEEQRADAWSDPGTC
ncbi:hypothetical protein [Cyclobacterium lianum]|nr:hypothetical protein [Cyclobacterium lianum]